MKKDKPTQKERIEHILAAISNIKVFMKDISLEAFAENQLLQSAVKWNFVVIGEAIWNVDQAIVEKHSIPSQDPKSFLNYFLESHDEVMVERTYIAIQDLEELENTLSFILKNDLT